MISVLYVDDDPSLLEISKLYLEDSGEFYIDTIDSASRALSILQQADYDAVVSDYQMPEMNGMEFLTALRRKNPMIPVIIFTGKDREEIADTGFENGTDIYHHKGGDPETQFAELSQKIRNSVEQYHANLALREKGVRFHDQIQTVSDNIRILDNDGRILCDSPSTSQILGYPDLFLIGKYAMDFIHPEDQKTMITALDQIRNKRDPKIPFGLRIRKADGVYIGVEMVGMNRVGADGVEGIVITTCPAPKIT